MSNKLFTESSFDVRPILKWVGGKRELLPEIRKYYRDIQFEKYIEPFFGGGAVYFDILRTFGEHHKEKAIINDVNEDLINMYRDVKALPKELIKAVREVEADYLGELGYGYIRNRFNGIETGRISKEERIARQEAGLAEREIFMKYQGIERSAALIVLNRTCFNGLYRVNPKGHFNVPKGNYKNPKILDEGNMLKVSELLPPLENIRNVQFDEISEIAKGDLVYFDPPYHPLSATSSFVSYSGSFGSEEQVRLMEYFKQLNDLGIYVLQSNSSAEFIDNIYSTFQVEKVYCRRNINSKASQRGKIPENLILGSLFK